jgi:hypothetical protein
MRREKRHYNKVIRKEVENLRYKNNPYKYKEIKNQEEDQGK